MAYQVPAQDVRFIFKELAGLDDVLALPGFEDVSADLIDAVLEENARFVEQVIAPLNRRGDTDPARWDNGAVITTPGFREAFRQYASGGWQGLQHDPRWGGQGLPKMVAAAADESINAANLAFSLCPLLTDGVVEALATVGSPAQRDRYIPSLIEGRWTGTMNLTEPQAGSDLSLITTRAEPGTDGTYRLSGQKIFITYGEHDLAENIVHLVLARTPDAPPGVKGISLFIVPKFLVNDDGSLGARNDVWCASLEHKLGIHASPTAVLLYGGGKGQVGAGGAVGYLVGEAHHGLEYMFVMMNAARYAVGIQGIAISERALQKAQAYAHERVQGEALDGSAGAVAIVNHPDVRRMLLTMRALTEGARALAYVAAAELDRAHRQADLAARERSRQRYEYLVPVIKGFSTEVAVEVASLGIQVHGGAGYIEETGAAQYFRDARILPIYEGTTAIQANDFVGRKTLRDTAAVARDLMAAMRSTAFELAAANGGDHAAGLDLIVRHLRAAVDAHERATNFMLARAASDARAVLLGSVPYLMLAGVTLAGWQMARAALVCARRLEARDGDSFTHRKFATCVFYAAHVLPRAQALADAIAEGDVVGAISREFFSA